MVSVTVWGKSVEIEVYQRSKAVWVASGTYMEQNITVTAQTRGGAVNTWKDAAKYKGNG